MKVVLESQEKIKVVVPGLYQFNESKQFTQAALAITEEELIIYDDSKPDSKTDSQAYFAARKKVDIKDILHLLVENIIGKFEVEGMMRLNFILKSIKESFFFYFKGNDNHYVKLLVKQLKKHKVEISKRKVNLKKER